MTKFEFLKQNNEIQHEKTLDRYAQKLKALIIEQEYKINPIIEAKLKKYLQEKDVKKLNISEENILNQAIELIKQENGGVLPEALEKKDENLEAA